MRSSAAIAMLDNVYVAISGESVWGFSHIENERFGPFWRCSIASRTRRWRGPALSFSGIYAASRGHASMVYVDGRWACKTRLRAGRIC